VEEPFVSHSFINALFHCVFSTKARRGFIAANLQERLWPFMGGIAREQGAKAMAIGGVEDHVHLLLSLPATISVAKAIQSIKGASSKWVHETFSEHRSFAWQEGYGAFSIGVAQVDATIAYIQSQAEHHRRTTFQEEFRMFLKKHGIEYDERYVLGVAFDRPYGTKGHGGDPITQR
jgi:putative transposase